MSLWPGANGTITNDISIIVDSENTKFDSRNNCNAIIESATNTLMLGCKKTIISNNVTTIGEYAFCGCTGLTSVTIPNSVIAIRGYAFFECDNLSIVVSKIENPFSISNSVYTKTIYDNATLYVPSGTIEKYKATEGWKDFVFIEELPDNPYDLNGDTKISTADIQVIINDMKKPADAQDMKYDLNGDGKISTADIQVIINEMKK